MKKTFCEWECISTLI